MRWSGWTCVLCSKMALSANQVIPGLIIVPSDGIPRYLAYQRYYNTVTFNTAIFFWYRYTAHPYVEWTFTSSITRREAIASPSIGIWKDCIARLNGVHAFVHNSAASELIWMKFGALWVYCLPLAWHILGAIRAAAIAREWGEIFLYGK